MLKLKKRGILLFSVIFLSIFIQPVYSIFEESVYTGTVKHGEIIEISNSEFQFRIDFDSSKVVVDVDSSGLIIESGQCRIKNNFDICLKNISFSHRNLTSYLDIYQVDIQVYQIKSSVDITHTIDKSNILIGEEAIVELSVENIADLAAEDFTATILIPNSILVMETEGCKKSLDSIIFKENVQPSQIKKCTYKIKGVSGDEFDLSANASYFNGIETISVDSSVSVKVYNNSLKISSSMDKDIFEVDDKFNLTIDVKNINDQYDLTLTTFNIKVPNNILILKKPKEMVKNNQILSWRGTLNAEEQKNFTMVLQPQRTGNYSIAIESSYKISTFLRNEKHESIVEVGCDCPYILYELSPEAYSPGQKILLKAFLINPDISRSFTNLKLSYVTNIPDLQDFSTSYQEIGPQESIEIFDSSFAAPTLEETYNFDIRAVYESENKEIFFEKENIVVRIPEQAPEIEEAEEIVEEVQEETVVLEETTVETVEEAEESSEQKEEVPVITLEKENPLGKYMLVVVFGALVFMAVIFFIFTKKARKIVKAPVKQDSKKRGIKDILHLDLLKKKNSTSNVQHGNDYLELQRQIEKLGIEPKDHGKKGFGLFKRK